MLIVALPITASFSREETCLRRSRQMSFSDRMIFSIKMSRSWLQICSKLMMRARCSCQWETDKFVVLSSRLSKVEGRRRLSPTTKVKRRARDFSHTWQISSKASSHDTAIKIKRSNKTTNTMKKIWEIARAHSIKASIRRRWVIRD